MGDYRGVATLPAGPGHPAGTAAATACPAAADTVRDAAAYRAADESAGTAADADHPGPAAAAVTRDRLDAADRPGAVQPVPPVALPAPQRPPRPLAVAEPRAVRRAALAVAPAAAAARSAAAATAPSGAVLQFADATSAGRCVQASAASARVAVPARAVEPPRQVRAPQALPALVPPEAVAVAAVVAPLRPGAEWPRPQSLRSAEQEAAVRARPPVQRFPLARPQASRS